MAERPKSLYTFYDPETYRILVRSGQPISEEVERRLKELSFYEVAVKGGQGENEFVQVVAERIGFGRKGYAWAYVRLKSGEGRVVINGRPAEQQFGWLSWKVLLKPFEIVGIEASEWDMEGKVEGSSRGSKAQVRALLNAIAGALVKFFPEKRQALRQAGFRWQKW